MMLKWLWCLLFVGFAINQNDFLPPNYVYIEPIIDFYQGNSVNIEVIITDRNEIEVVYMFYRFTGETAYSKQQMQLSYQPVIYELEIPSEDVKPGYIQYYFFVIYSLSTLHNI